jgi:hypothetical protein
LYPTTTEVLAFRERATLCCGTTFPKLMVGEVTVSCPDTVVPVPVPDKDIVRDALDAFKVIKMLPLTVAADAGVNVTLEVLL